LTKALYERRIIDTEDTEAYAVGPIRPLSQCHRIKLYFLFFLYESIVSCVTFQKALLCPVSF